MKKPKQIKWYILQLDERHTFFHELSNNQANE
jgi:hypothetical protein